VRLDVEEVDDPAYEALGVLEVGAVAGVGKQHQLGVGEALVEVVGVDRRDDDVVAAVDDEGGLGDAIEVAEVIRGRRGPPPGGVTVSGLLL
jgi:hypothetical protein